MATLDTVLCRQSYNLAIFIHIFINFCCQISDKQKSRPTLCRSELSIRSLLCEGDGFQINTVCTLWDRLDIWSEWSQSGIGGDRKFPSLLYCHRTREKLSIWFSLSKPKLDASSVSFIHWKTFIKTYFWVLNCQLMMEQGHNLSCMRKISPRERYWRPERSGPKHPSRVAKYSDS